MSTPIWQVDSFSSEPFSGNPAGVCLLDQPRPDEWLQQVAREMNLSETAFLLRRDEGWLLRWFTPAVEVRLCGHATLASAHILWYGDLADPAQAIRFFTRYSGELTARRRDELIELDFPARPPRRVAPPAGLIEALGITAVEVFRDREDYLVLVQDAATVRAVAPDFQRLRGVEARGVIVTAASDDPEYDFVSRFFAPAVGIDEDPVTGSAHCCLCPFWAERLGKQRLVGYQASARGGVVKVETTGERVKLAGPAVTIFEGQLLV